MKKIIAIILLLIFFCFLGCQHNSEPKPTASPSADKILEEIKAESDSLAEKGKKLDEIEVISPKKIEIMPVKPEYDPLEDQIVSFSMVDEDLRMVLYTIARSMGMNLIIDPDISTNERLLTINFEKVSASQVFNEVLSIYDLYYEVDKNIIRIRPFQEKMFKLNFLDSSITSTFDIGGDVLGAGESEASTGLSGSYRITGEGVKKGNPYDEIDDTIKRIKTPNGIYALNRTTGTLYIKDTPSVINATSKIIHNFKKIMSKQILIKARILEVSLLDEYKYGIDWSVVRDKSQSATTLTQVSWSWGSGLAISNNNADISINPMGEAIDALKTFGDTKVISNPIIRCKHGKPSIISVGTSFSYKKSVDTTTTTSGLNPITETDVEVSTVFDGLILGVTPFIEENGRISLQINPIKSDVDPESLELVSVGGSSSGQSISLPEVHIKELSSTIAMNNNDVIILGGLIDKNEGKIESGVPYISSIPVLGYLFRRDVDREETREMVILLTVSII